MPPKSSCHCGRCLRCRNRVAQRRRRRAAGPNPSWTLRLALADYCRGVEDAGEALAELSGLEPQIISEIRRGLRDATDEETDALCCAIGTHVELLYLYGSGAPA